MESYALGNTFQSAYKVVRSTETALLCIQNEILVSLAKGMPTALVLCPQLWFSLTCQLPLTPLTVTYFSPFC